MEPLRWRKSRELFEAVVDAPSLAFALEHRVLLDLFRTAPGNCARGERPLHVVKADALQGDKKSVYRNALHQACSRLQGRVDALERWKALVAEYKKLAAADDPYRPNLERIPFSD